MRPTFVLLGMMIVGCIGLAAVGKAERQWYQDPHAAPHMTHDDSLYAQLSAISRDSLDTDQRRWLERASAHRSHRRVMHVVSAALAISAIFAVAALGAFASAGPVW